MPSPRYFAVRVLLMCIPILRAGIMVIAGLARRIIFLLWMLMLNCTPQPYEDALGDPPHRLGEIIREVVNSLFEVHFKLDEELLIQLIERISDIVVKQIPVLLDRESASLEKLCDELLKLEVGGDRSINMPVRHSKYQYDISC